MTRKIAVAMRKGGTGKTTTAVNLATALMLRKKRVLLVDLDSQANASIALGINPLDVPHTLNDLFLNDELSAEKAITTKYGLHVLPGHGALARTESGMGPAQVASLRTILEPIEGEYDYVILDVPPSDSLLPINALAYATEIITPLQTEYFAMEGLAQAMEQVKNVRKGLNPSLRVIGILPTRVKSSTNLARSIIEETRERYPELVYPFWIEESVRHPEATARGVPIVILDPGHQGAITYKKLAEHIDEQT
jgi:chromosome partitioning protein